jgi:PIN domain nuclease of toxin-antitoxin system
MILLDTQTLVWYLKGDKRLGPKSTRVLVEADVLYFSSLSILEYEIKLSDRSLGGERKVLRSAIERGLIELVPKGQELELASDFPSLRNHDPIDRALVLQAAWHNASFFTSDQKLLQLNMSWIHDSQI